MTSASSFGERLEAVREAADPAWPTRPYNPKLAGRAFAMSLGLRVPAMLVAPCALDDLRPPTEPRFVVKSNEGAVARGVVPLIRDGDGYRDLFGRGFSTWDDVIRYLRGRSGEGRISGPYFVEAMIGDGVPLDWKAFVVGGVVQYAYLRRPGRHGLGRTSQYQFLGRKGRRIPPPRVGTYQLDPEIPLPANHAALVDVAERIAAAIATPFVRVDLYEDAEGPVFGEITPFPGGAYVFYPKWDQRMADAWDAWERRR